MSNEQITITHHPATETAPQHWRSSDGKWSASGGVWLNPDGTWDGQLATTDHAAAFFSQILNAEEEPRHAEIDDWVRSIDSPACFQVKFVDHGEGTVWSEEEGDGGMGLRHGEYTIVDPPQPLTAKGSDITQKDGVWESKDKTMRWFVSRRVLICGCSHDGYWYTSDIDNLTIQTTYTHISDDPRELTNWEVE